MKRNHWNAAILFTLLIVLCITSFVTSAPAKAAPGQTDTYDEHISQRFYCHEEGGFHVSEILVYRACEEQLKRARENLAYALINQRGVLNVHVRCDTGNITIKTLKIGGIPVQHTATGYQDCFYRVTREGKPPPQIP